MKTVKRKTMTDPILLRQKIIYLQSEVTKYKNIVEKYENNYQFQQFEQLMEENKLLKEQLDNAKTELQTKNEALQQKLVTSHEKDEGELEYTIQQLKQENIKLKEKNDELEKKYHSLLNTINNNETNNGDNYSDQELKNISFSIDELQIIREIENEIKDLFIQSFQNESNIDLKTVIIQELEKKIDKLTSELETLSSGEEK